MTEKIRRTKYIMEICNKHPESNQPISGPWDEDIPSRLNAKGAPDIEGEDACTRADLAIRWFNDTLRLHEEPRMLLAVHRVEEIEIWRRKNK